MSATDQSWRTRAMCFGLDADEIEAKFFPHPNDAAKEAKAICKVCPVAAECLTFALTTGQDEGVWGAMTEQERRALRLRKKYPKRPNVPTPDPRCGTHAGTKAHVKRLEQFCDDCRMVKNEYESERRRRLTAERKASA